MERRRLGARGCGAALLIALLLQTAAASVLADWTPPENPDPYTILADAQIDAGAGRYADALAKHVWFYENALKYAPSMTGVRRSFALSYWVKLAEVYPPALARLKALRDEAAEAVRGGSDPRNAFFDFAAINRELKETSETRSLFVWLDAEKPDIARQVYDAAEPALIEAKDYRLCGKYLDPDHSYGSALFLYRYNKRFAQEPGPGLGNERASLEAYAEDFFARSTATLVALLVLNGRKADADRIAAQAFKDSDNPGLKGMLEKAKGGELPPTWP